MNAAFWKKHPGLVWSNRQADDSVWIRAALLDARFHPLLEIAVEFGRERVEAEWAVLENEGERETQRAAPATRRILRHIAEGFADAGR